MLDQPRDVGKVLVQRSAERDVHHLQASTDAERGQGDPVGREEQLDLTLVPIRLDPIEVPGGLSPVPRGVDVAAAHEKEAVEGLQDLLGRALLAGSDDRRSGSRSPERVEVQARDAVPALRPPGDAVAPKVVRHHGDEGSVAILGHDVECSDGSSRSRHPRPGS